MKEMHRRGRNNQQKGSKCGKSKIDESTAINIFTATGTLKSIGSQFGISYGTVWAIKSKKTWKHIH